ncbi:thioesterase II family protein [Paenibacillus arenosi]|uniref:Thioesterase n=1 Tax=Paenibacillus arenosi TaxID=2774142 RepID=A0ABR9AWN0_9BACL|nr:alpha/beta fold hydrolase [Paenibacillus arenosi]MBD8498541.1 thioesterase [Paenibacillus arenosi]
MSSRVSVTSKLICLPYAGGGATAFQALRNQLLPNWDIISMDPPGHGSNEEMLTDDLEELVRYYLNQYHHYFTDEFALFGYSMGGKIVHRMGQQLQSEGKYPKTVIISSMYPPDIKVQKISHLERNLFLRHLVSLGGITEELIQHEEFVNYFLPIIRADFRAVEEHVCPDDTPLHAPVHVFVGLQDERATPEAVTGWTNWADNVSFTYFDAGHMFLSNQADEVAYKLNHILSM